MHVRMRAGRAKTILMERLGEFDLESGGAALSCALRAQ